MNAISNSQARPAGAATRGADGIGVLVICPELPSTESPGSMAPAARQIESLRALGVEMQVVDMKGIPKLKYLAKLPQIRRLAKSVDLLHAHFGYCGWLARIALFGSRRKPIVMSYMGDDLLGTPVNKNGDLGLFSRLMVSLNIRLARGFDRVIVKSQEMAEVIAPVSASVIPNGVDLQSFKPMEQGSARRALNWPRRSRAVLFPGNPDNPRKGHALAQAAMQVAERELGEQITLQPLWGVDPGQVAVMMNACDAMLMTSLIEGSPNVVKEAMACDCPIVAVPVGDVATMLEGVAGCHVADRQEETLGKLLATAMTAGDCRGREAILAKSLDLDSVARRVLAEYQLALTRGGVDHRRARQES